MLNKILNKKNESIFGFLLLSLLIFQNVRAMNNESNKSEANLDNKTPYFLETENRKNIIASCYLDNTIKILDLSMPEGQECIQTLKGHEDWIKTVVFSPFNPNILASCSKDNTVKIWNLSKPKGQECFRTLTGHTATVTAVVFSPFNPNIIASCSDDDTVKTWDLSKPERQECLRTLTEHLDAVNAVVFSPFNPNIIASCSWDKTIKIWDLSKPKDQECIRTLTNHEYIVNEVVFSPFNPSIIASCSSDNTIKVWDLSKPKGQECIRTLTGHTATVNAVVFSPFNPNIIVSCSEDNTVKIWDLSKPESHECVRTLTGHKDFVLVRAVAFATRIHKIEDGKIVPIQTRQEKFVSGLKDSKVKPDVMVHTYEEENKPSGKTEKLRKQLSKKELLDVENNAKSKIVDWYQSTSNQKFEEIMALATEKDPEGAKEILEKFEDLKARLTKEALMQ